MKATRESEDQNQTFDNSKEILASPMVSTSATGQVSEDSDLVAALHALSIKSPKLVKSSSYPAPADPSIEVRSWKMNELKYHNIPLPFPTLARGLFSMEIPHDVQEDGKQRRVDKRYQIVVRGYDKFFNIGEVPWTTVFLFSNLSPFILY